MAQIFKSEKRYIEHIVLLISTELKVEPNAWQQRDFENLNILIEEKTGVNLSVSTLKRIWKQQFSNIPQKNTLNALASFMGYKDWFEFKKQNLVPENKKTGKQKSVHKFKLSFFSKGITRFFYIPVSAIAIIFILLIVFKSEQGQSYVEAHFSSRKSVSEGVPNTIIFDYDISKFEVDSAFIQQSWDKRRRARIYKHEKYSTSQYYYPGYHLAKLIINNQLVKEIPVYITTRGWLSIIRNPENEVVPVYVKENCMKGGRIYISPETIESYNIGLESNDYTTSFYYVNEDFAGDSDNFTLETSIKNSLDEGGVTCQGCMISILAESGRHYISFCDPGCVANLSLKFGKKYIMGRNNDLSAFGTGLNQWNDIRFRVKNRLVQISLNGEIIYKTEIEKSNGKIKGVFYYFAGCGAIDYVKLYDAEDNMVFSEDF